MRLKLTQLIKKKSKLSEGLLRITGVIEIHFEDRKISYFEHL